MTRAPVLVRDDPRAVAEPEQDFVPHRQEPRRGGRILPGSWRVRQVKQLAPGLVPEADQRALVVERGDGLPEVARREPGPGGQVGGRRGTEPTQVAPDDVPPRHLDRHAAPIDHARVVEPGTRRRDQRTAREGPAHLLGDMDEWQRTPHPPPDRRLQRPSAGVAGQEVTQLEASARRDGELGSRGRELLDVFGARRSPAKRTGRAEHRQQRREQRAVVGRADGMKRDPHQRGLDHIPAFERCPQGPWIEVGEACPQGEERRGGFLRLDAADLLERAHGIKPGRSLEQQLACQRRAVERARREGGVGGSRHVTDRRRSPGQPLAGMGLSSPGPVRPWHAAAWTPLPYQSTACRSRLSTPPTR